MEADQILNRLKNDKTIAEQPIFKHNKCLFEGLNAGSHVLATLVG